MFTLSHHIVVRYAALSLGIKNFDSYILLGDDIVINHDGVAIEYRNLMLSLGVEISKSKTHTSYYVYEFAKRWIDSRIGEVTGLPMKGVIDNISNIFIIFQILFDYFMVKGNMYIAKANLAFVVVEILRVVQLRSQGLETVRGFKAMFSQLEPLAVFMRIKFDLASYDEIRNYLAKNVRNNDIYMLPGRQVVRDEISRVMSLALLSTAWSSSRKLSTFFKDL